MMNTVCLGSLLDAADWVTTERIHQSIVSAGHGARAAISLIRDDLAARFWLTIADHYVDWAANERHYGGDD